MLHIERLVKSFPGEKGRRATERSAARVRAVDDVSFTVEEGELFTLLGPSGCGKTTTLRSIAGLETPDGGRIEVSGRVLFDGERKVRVPANQRRLGMVFQSYAIWPHMTVFENVVFPLRALSQKQRPSSAKMKEEVARVLTLLQLEDFSSRPATNLSGGQQQRLALARALVVRPEVLLLDEPLSNLDAKLRESLRLELKRLQRETGQTTVYVTHDQAEALALSSRIAVMQQGRIMQIGKPREIYNNPENRFVAEFIGTSNFVPATVLAVEGDRYTVETPFGDMVAIDERTTVGVGDSVIIAIRPEAMNLCENGATPPAGGLAGVVRTRAFLGDVIDHIIEVAGVELRVRSNPSVSIDPGRPVSVTAAPQNVRIIAAEGE